MFYNHLKIAWRQLQRQRVTSTINILGLALAVAVALLIGLYIRQESSYDTGYATHDPIVRVYRHWGTGNEWVHSPGELAPALTAEIPEVQSATHISATEEVLLSVGEKKIYAQSIIADSSFFTTIPMPFQAGDPVGAFDAPNAAVLSAKMAGILFGDQDPVGQTILRDGTEPMVVTGVIQPGFRSHLSRDIYIRQFYPNFGWLSNNFATYARLQEQSDPKQVAEKIYQVTRPHLELAFQSFGYEIQENAISKWGLQPIERVHLHSSGYTWSDAAGGDIRYLYIFGLVAVILLSVAIFNYANLTTAQAGMRSKEVGVRKVTGAAHRQLLTQFFTETTLQTMIALGLGGFIAGWLLPVFQQLMEIEVDLRWQSDWKVVPLFIAGGLLIGVVASLYPSLVLTRLRPERIFRNNQPEGRARFSLRQVLVIAQFVVVISMLSMLGVMMRQMNYMLRQDLGFDSDQVLTIPHNDFGTAQLVRNKIGRLESIPQVQKVSLSSDIPGQALGSWSLIYREERAPEPTTVSTEILFVDPGIQESWGLELQDGRFFETQRPADSLNFVVNEAFLQRYHIKDPFNTPIRLFADSIYRSIIGVVKDFHFQSLDQSIRPIAMTGTNYRMHTSVRLATRDLSQTIAAIKAVWTEIEPHHPIRYSFLDQRFAQQYELQGRFRKGMTYATMLAIFIALLGLFGLATFAIQRRRKEIGIRKVLGATVRQLVGQLNRSFLQLVGIAVLVAIPLSWFLANRWLENFAYQTDMPWWLFILSGLASILIATITVSTQSFRAAVANPVDAIRDE